MFYRLYTLLEQAAHELDLALAREKSGSRQAANTFECYSSHLQRMQKLTEERDAHAAGILDQLITRMALCSATEVSAAAQINHVNEAVATYRKKAQELV